MINITLKDGSVLQKEAGITPLAVAQEISSGLARAALLASVNGKFTDLTLPLFEDCTLSVLTWDDSEGMDAIRHTASMCWRRRSSIFTRCKACDRAGDPRRLLLRY